MTNFAEQYAELYERYAADIFHFALWLTGDTAEAEDIMSETFVRAWAGRERIHTETMKGYLLTIARNLHLKGWRERQRYTALDEQTAAREPSPEQVTAVRDELAAVMAIMAHWPEVDRTALLLSAHHALPYAEIARILGLTETAVKVKIHRARLKLAQNMGD